jgi:dTDP-4-amino-4,6-dideoxygalactose transaminase
MDYDIIASGYNYRMDDIRGAILLAQFKKLQEDIAKREKLRNLYIEELKQIDEIIVPYKNHLYRSSNYIFPIVLKNSNKKKRNIVRHQLAKLGIETSVHYPAVHKFSIYKGINVDLPKTEYAADNEITLPLYFNLNDDQVIEISQKLAKILKDMRNEKY